MKRDKNAEAQEQCGIAHLPERAVAFFAVLIVPLSDSLHFSLG